RLAGDVEGADEAREVVAQLAATRTPCSCPRSRRRGRGTGWGCGTRGGNGADERALRRRKGTGQQVRAAHLGGQVVAAAHLDAAGELHRILGTLIDVDVEFDLELVLGVARGLAGVDVRGNHL